ncbi:sialidase family protein [Algoriphagus sp. CAU 1675]|uniref:sialidase family protein n=1 Tax=Algoriphagus sp. CAU 1675 TaxID=3032597 RepID=UPI0023DBB587|nr:sialidase family protein [Algoriphagus sp. CAU 1675]MDF2157273.1 exo-alpha-sialidase [Algoriphagus sp. CAU 1675]
MQALILFLLSLSLSNQTEKPEVKILKSEFIYETAPFPQCHASTLIENEEGILAAWFGGTHERHPDVSIYTAQLNGEKWSEPKKAADGVENEQTRYPTWNPVLYRLDNGKTVLFYKIGPNPREWWGAYKLSDDLGKTWSEEIPLPDGILGPIKNKPVALSNGKILYPSSLETEEKWTIHVESSDSNLENWKKTEIENGKFNAIQPTVFFHPDGRLQMLCRTQEGKIGVTWSDDQGATWTPVQATNLVHNNSGIDGVTLQNGYHLLLCNPIPKGRNKLSLMGSTDGVNWEELLVMEDEKKGEFSYPAIIQASDGTVHLTYTYNREKVKYAQLKIN